MAKDAVAHELHTFRWDNIRHGYTVAVVLGFSYIISCSLLRYRRRDTMHKKFNYPTRASFSHMTATDAQQIITYMGELEFPKMMKTSLQFALFKTYGIPTISSLLVATKQFSTPENASKRYADTSILILEFFAHAPRSERAVKAIARMNYIHSSYQKAGKISNDDLLYTLSVFITEPIAWVEKYEWRSMTPMEVCAMSTFWKGVGDDMGIDYAGRLARSTWVDGIEFYEDIKQWAEEYAAQYMVPATSNKVTCDELVPILLFFVPSVFRDAATNIVGVLMGEQLRAAMMFPTPSDRYFTIADAVLMGRARLLRYLSLPRPEFLAHRELSDAPDPQTKRYHVNEYQAHPFYNKPGLLNRWGPEAWFVWVMGGDVPGSKGDLYVPEGYTFEDIGPDSMKNKGTEETKTGERQLYIQRQAGCPFTLAR